MKKCEKIYDLREAEVKRCTLLGDCIQKGNGYQLTNPLTCLKKTVQFHLQTLTHTHCDTASIVALIILIYSPPLHTPSCPVRPMECREQSEGKLNHLFLLCQLITLHAVEWLEKFASNNNTSVPIKCFPSDMVSAESTVCRFRIRRPDHTSTAKGVRFYTSAKVPQFENLSGRVCLGFHRIVFCVCAWVSSSEGTGLHLSDQHARGVVLWCTKGGPLGRAVLWRFLLFFDFNLKIARTHLPQVIFVKGSHFNARGVGDSVFPSLPSPPDVG